MATTKVTTYTNPLEATTGKQTWVETGTPAAATYIIGEDVTNAKLTLRGTGDKIVIEGSSSDFEVRAAGKTLVLVSDTQTITINMVSAAAKVGVANTLSFLDGDVAVAAGNGVKGIKVGGVTVTNQKGKAFPENATVDATKTTAIDHFSGTSPIPGSTGGNSGETFKLTTSVDSFVGTSGNDTFVGLQTGGLDDTFGPADEIDGGDGADELTIVHTEAATALNVATVKNVETVVLRVAVDQATDGADAVDMDNLVGVTSLVLDRTVGANDITNIAASTALTFTGSTATMDTTATWKASGVTGAADSTTVTLNGVKAGADIELAGDIETVTIKTTGAASSLADLVLDAQTTALVIDADEALTVATTLTTAGVTKLTTKGDSLVTVTPALGASIVEVDASAQTAGGTSVILGTNAKFTGGAGNDVVDTTLNTTKAVTGGNGTDTVVFTASTNYATTATLVSGFETLRGSGAGASYNVAAISGITAVQAEATAGTLTFSGLSTQTIEARNNITALVTTLANATGTADALSITIDDSDTAAAAITLGDISAAGVETLNLTTGDALATGTAHIVSDFDLSTSLKTVKVAGTSDLTLTDISDLAANATIDAASFAHRLIVGGVGAGDTVKGGSANDSVTVAFANLGTTTAFVGGAGDDTLTVSDNGSDMVDGDFASLSGVDNLVIDSATTTSVTLQGYAQSMIGTVDFNADGRLDITAANLTTGGTINAGDLLSKGVDVSATLTLAAGTNGNAALAITGGAVTDTITVVVDAVADTGDDTSTTAIAGGNGIDIISYTLNNAGSSDVLTIVSSATTLANSDIITGFVSGTDTFDYNGALSNGAVTDDVANATLAGAIAAQAAYGTYIVQTDIADSGANTSGAAFTTLLGSTAANLSANFEALKTQLVASGGIFNGAITGLDAAIAQDETALIALDNGTGSVILRFTNSSATGNTVLASELELVGVLTNTAALAAGDFV